MYWRSRMSPGRIVSLWTIIFGHLYIGCLRLGSSSVNAEMPDIIKVLAVTGGDATLPCNSHSSKPSDVLLLVAWYKDGVPIYSYDGRVNGPASHWADDTLTGRVHWQNAEPSTLQIRDVVPSDRALYKCRADFKISPTLNQKILLDVIEIPEKPKIFDEHDKEVVEFAGPYIEDASMKLTCVVSGGKPMPRLRWWRDDKVISTLPPTTDGSSLSTLQLRIPKLTRQYYEAVFYCTADNTVLVQPLRANVQTRLYLRPLFVEILTREQPLSVMQRAVIACKTGGARPPAVISWWLDNVRLTSAEQKTSDDQNETLSMLRWTPQMENNGKKLECRASHSVFKHWTIQTNFTLDLYYVPIVNLRLGSKLNPADIKEGDDVYFECVVRANPPAYKVVWEHDGLQMKNNLKAGIIAASANLVLQKVTRKHAGQYSCTASNVEGDATSTPVALQVIYKPLCKMTTMALVGAIINENVHIICDVDAYPRPVSYQWILKNSLGSVKLQSDTKSNGSILTFTPKSEADYGTVSCKASNKGGQQVTPCLYTVIAAVRPDRPHNCSASNITDDSLQLRCIAGYEGGLQTEYTIEAWQSNELVLNESSPTSAWTLRGLAAGKAFKLVIYAHNGRGRSDNFTLMVHTSPQIALQTELISTPGTVVEDAKFLQGLLLGLAVTFVFIMVISLLAWRRFPKSAQYAAPVGTKAYSSTLNGNQSPMRPDDKNLDMKRFAKGLNYAQELKTFPQSPLYDVPSTLRLSKNAYSLQHETRSNAHTQYTPGTDAQSIGTRADDRRSVTSGTLSRRREIVTTWTPLLPNARESRV